MNFVRDTVLKPKHPPANHELEAGDGYAPLWYTRWWVWTALALLALLMGIMLAIRQYIVTFEQASEAQITSLLHAAQMGWTETYFNERGQITVLLYGIDETTNQREGSLLTDTLMLMILNKDTTVDLISIPRDLWIDSLKTKINALYYYGDLSEATTGEELLANVLEDITGLDLDHTMQLNLETVRLLVNAMGGVDIYVENGFVDERFPREAVDISSDDPDVLYETVRFEEGWQHMDGTRALKYIRSRQSQDETEGTDLARSRRQQHVIQALLAKAKTREFLLSPEKTGSLYRIWSEEVQTDIPDALLVSVIKAWAGSAPEIVPHQIPVMNAEREGVLYHPPMDRYDQWVYAPVDPTWNELKLWMEQALE